MSLRIVLALCCCVASGSLSACTIAHSKQALWKEAESPPSPDSTFVTEEDSGLSLLGLVVLTEPDHYVTLLERARLRYRCNRLRSPQLDFFTDYWVIVAFPIARVTVLCEKGPRPASPLTPVP